MLTTSGVTIREDLAMLAELGYEAVSYTHLDVYKRQLKRRSGK